MKAGVVDVVLAAPGDGHGALHVPEDPHLLGDFCRVGRDVVHLRV